MPQTPDAPDTKDATVPHMTTARFRELGHQMVDYIADYWDTLESRPVRADIKPGDVLSKLPSAPPTNPAADTEWPDIFKDLDDTILPNLTHWQHPNFFAYFPCNASFPAILGEMFRAGLNVNGMLWATSPAATELETRIMDWCADLFHLPEAFRSTTPNAGGCIQGTASEATLIALLAGAKRIGRERHNLAVFCSAQAHSSVAKAAMIAGVADHPEDERIITIPVDRNHAMRADHLRDAMQRAHERGLTPALVVATMGTTATTGLDPIAAIAEVIDACEGPKPWLHVDAAYSGVTLLDPEHHATHARGLDRVDSLTINAHKWLLTNFDCSLFWTRDLEPITAALSITPEYLRNEATDAGAVTDYRDWQIPLGRAFRALKLWFVIRHYGADGLRNYVNEHIAWARRFSSWVEADDRFELAAPVSSGLVCFRLIALADEPPEAADRRNAELMQSLNATGKILLSHAITPRFEADSDEPVRDQYIIRLALASPLTTEKHIEQAWALIREHADAAMR